MNFERAVLIIAVGAVTNGCSLFNRLNPDCHSSQDYQRAASVVPLKVPPGMDAPNTQGALVIPTVELAAPPPGPKDACLDVPPRYKAAPTNKAASG